MVQTRCTTLHILLFLRVLLLVFVETIISPVFAQEFVYSINSDTGDSITTILGYNINPDTGALTAAPGSPYNISPAAIPFSLTANPAGTFAYVPFYGNEGQGIALFSIDPMTGTLSQLGTNSIPFSTFSNLVFNPSGNFAYFPTASYLGYAVGGFAINSSTGAMTAVPGSPFTLGALFPLLLAADPAGQFLYVLNSITNINSADNIYVFRIDQNTGALTQVPGSPFALAGGDANFIAANPAGGFVYVSDTSGDVSIFAVNSTTGALMQIPGSPFAISPNSGVVSVGFTSSGTYVYMLAYNTIYGFKVDAVSGSLTALPGSPFSGVGFATSLTVDPASQFIYVGSGSSSTIFAYKINPSTGALLPVAGSPFPAPGGTTWVTSTRVPSSGLASPASLVFPTAGGTLPVTVTNTSTAPLSITMPQAFSGFNSFDFSVALSGTTCINGTIVAPGSSCTINIKFNPMTTSAESGTLSIFDNASNSPQNVALSGGAQLTSLTPNPVPGSKGAQVVTLTGSGFATGAVVNWQDLTNGGSGPPITPLSVTSSEVTASMKFTNATAAWQLQVANPTGAPSNWFSFEVLGSQYNYVPDDYPFQNAAVNPTVRDPYRFQFRECTSFVAWRMNRDAGTTNPSYPYFSNKMAGGTWGNAYMWNTNARTLGYLVNNVPEVGAIAQWLSGGCGGSCPDGHVAYVEQVNQDGSIVVSEYDYPQNTTISHEFNVRTIAVTSKVFPQNFIHVFSLKLGANLLNFGSQPRGSPTELQVAITNPVSQVIPVTGISITGKDAVDFTQTNTCGSSIPPSGSCEVTVTFTPMGQTPGSRSAILTINDTAGPPISQRITLVGSGT
jgi:surface antigen/6-phosphogluconolactonase (cycloisomerase 2 family)